MIRVIVTTLIFIAGLQVIAQDDNDSKFFIELNSGEKVYGSKVHYKTPAFGKARLEVDDKEFESENVKIYQNKEGYFIKDSYGGYKPRFYKREIDGEHIDTYSVMSTTYHYSGGAGGFGGAPGMGTMQTNKYIYYKKDNHSLSVMNYDNLKHDLQDNELSMGMLNKVRTIQIVNVSLVVAGAATLLYGISQMKKQDEVNQTLNPGDRDLSFHPGI